MFCTNCGNEISKETKFCGGCGAKVLSDVEREVKDLETTNIQKEESKRLYSKYMKREIWWFISPILSIFVTVSLWGFFSFLTEVSDNGAVESVAMFINLVVPIVIGIAILLFPAGFAMGIYYHIKKSDLE